ncbi:hypothetical protein CKO09_04290 [Chromatium weissei]|nr:hypothetical protein [Chromatium weissei]
MLIPSDIHCIRWQLVPTSALPPLAPNDVHLWRIRIDARGMNLSDCWTLLGDTQRQRAAALRLTERRAHYLRTHGGLRLILARYLSVEPAELNFIYGINGKPALANAALQFNLTTSGALALVAISATAAVGVDCELIRPQRRMLAIARRMFASKIVATLETAAETERLTLFYQAWTALEAEVKCDGRGLFRAGAADDIPPTIAHCIPQNGYIAAVARTDLPSPEKWLTFDLLTN